MSSSSHSSSYHGSSYSGGYYRDSREPSYEIDATDISGKKVGRVVIVIAVLLLILVVLISNSSSKQLTASTKVREPLAKDAVKIDAGYHTDGLHWIESAPKLTSGMKSFYEATGVMPYLYLAKDIYGDPYPEEQEFEDFAEDLYNSLFAMDGGYDEAHVLVVFQQYTDDDDYGVYVLPGLAAASVMDEEAQTILRDCINKYYWDEEKTNSEFFAAAFREAGKRIMQITRPAWYYPAITLGIVGAFAVVLTIIRTAVKAKEEQDKRNKEIVNYSGSEGPRASCFNADAYGPRLTAGCRGVRLHRRCRFGRFPPYHMTRGATCSDTRTLPRS